jgi:hypothetical protein
MPETDRKTAATGKEPVLVLNRVTFKKVTSQIRSETHAQLVKYVAFYQKVKNVKPEESELIDAALSRAFKEDTAFQEFLRNGGGNVAGATRQAAASEGQKGSGSEDLSQL